MAFVGEVGLVIYYVGLLLPKVDRRLIELSDELGVFSIIKVSSVYTGRGAAPVHERNVG